MELLGLMLFLHVNLGALIRMTQGSTPFGISLKTFKGFTAPWFLLRFSALRMVFLSLVIYNSLIVSYHFHRDVLVPYFSFYCIMISWIQPFVKGRFLRAFQIITVSTMLSIGIVFEVHELCPNIIWCIYLMYVSAWYKWCLPI